jgi:ABC-type Fe3+ transport system, periplasmic component
MNKYFDTTETIFDITEKYPEVIDILSEHGFENLNNDMLRKTLGKTITLKKALNMKKINVELFEQKIVDFIEESKSKGIWGGADCSNNKEGDIKIKGILPCPVRVPIIELFEKRMTEIEKEYGITTDYKLQSASMGIDWMKAEILKAETEKEISDIYLSAGFDLFFDKEFMGKFKDLNTFEDMSGYEKLNEVFENEQISLRDPLGQYSIIGVVPAIFTVNKEILGDRKFPESWKDLLSEDFRESIALPMKDLDLFNAILLHIYKEYGEDGVRSLGQNLFGSMHPSRMVKTGSKGNQNVPAITVMPYFFSSMIPKEGNIVVVWPKDGAIISPIFLLTKSSKKAELKVLAELFFGEEFGNILSGGGKFPVTNPKVDNDFSKDKKFMWIGWEYINREDIGNLIKETEKIFLEN